MTATKIIQLSEGEDSDNCSLNKGKHLYMCAHAVVGVGGGRGWHASRTEMVSVWETGLKRGSVQDEHELCGGIINELRAARRGCNV